MSALNPIPAVPKHVRWDLSTESNVMVHRRVRKACLRPSPLGYSRPTIDSDGKLSRRRPGQHFKRVEKENSMVMDGAFGGGYAEAGSPGFGNVVGSPTPVGENPRERKKRAFLKIAKSVLQERERIMKSGADAELESLTCEMEAATLGDDGRWRRQVRRMMHNHLDAQERARKEEKEERQ